MSPSIRATVAKVRGTPTLAYAMLAVAMVGVAAACYGDFSKLLIDTDDHLYFGAAADSERAVSLLFPFGGYSSARPITEWVFLGSYRVFGENATGHHVFVVGLHVLASLLLAVVLEKHICSREVAFATGLLFLSNVAHFRAVEWIACLAYPIGLVLSLCSLHCCMEGLRSRRWWWLVGGLALSFLAVLSHPATIAILCIACFLAWRLRPSCVRAIVPLVLPALGGIFGLVFLHVVYGSTPQVQDVARPFEALRSAKQLLWFLGFLWTTAHWFPSGLSYSSDRPDVWVMAIGGVFLLVGLLLVRRRTTTLLEGAAWAVVATVPFACYPGPHVPVGPSRYLYFASVGSSLMLGYSLWRLSASLGTRIGVVWEKITLSACLLLFVLVSAYALHHTRSLSFYVSGRSYLARGSSDLGILQLERAVDRDPLLVPRDTYVRLAAAGFVHGRPERWALEKALTRGSEPVFKALLGLSQILDGNPAVRDSGEARVERILAKSDGDEELESGVALCYHNLAGYWLMEKQYRLAIRLYLNVVHLEPAYLNAWTNLGYALRQLHEYDRAVYALRTALRLAPDSVETMNLLADALLAQGSP